VILAMVRCHKAWHKPLADSIAGEHWRRAAALYVVPIENIIRSRVFVTASNQVYERRSANRSKFRAGFLPSVGRQSGFRKKMLTYINKN